MKEMVWNVFIENFNGKKIESYNIFDHRRFMEDIEDNYKKNKNDYEAFCKQLKMDLQYYYWSKCEWEVIISSWPPVEKNPIEEKIDVYDQVMQNEHIFYKYVWDMCHARKNSKDAGFSFEEE